MKRKNVGDEIVEQLIIIAGAVITLYLTKKMMQPDFAQMVKMRAALTVKKVADRQVREWEYVASKAATAYQKARV